MTTIGALLGLFLLPNGALAAPAPSIVPVAYQFGSALVLSERPSYAVTLTAYNAVPEQTDDDPYTTASGAYSNPEVVAARSRDLAEELPFGTVIEIDGSKASKGTCGYDIVEPIIGYRVIADTMHPRFTKRIDILFSTEDNFTLSTGATKNAGTVLGICDGVVIRIVGHLDLARPSRLPDTQFELASLVRDMQRSKVALK